MGEMPDFEKMTLEEQMRWLESLAKRQGAYEGFTTSADMDVPELDPNSVVIDEPGYTPSESFGSKKAAPPAVASAPPPPVIADTQPTAPVSAVPVTPIAEPVAGGDDPLGGMDPMKWLESLAKRQGAYEGFTTSADLDIPVIDPSTVVIDEPGYTPSETFGRKKESAPVDDKSETRPVYSAAPEVLPAAPTYETPPVAEQPTYDYGYDYQQPAAETAYGDQTYYYDQQQYTDQQQYADQTYYYDQQYQYTDQQYADQAYYQQPDQTYDPNYYYADASTPAAYNEPPAQMPEPAAASADDPLGGMDPLKWLESLAKRQGANPEEFVTSADYEVAEVDPATAVIDEPGYTPFENFGKKKEAPPAESPVTPLAPPPMEFTPPPPSYAPVSDFAAAGSLDGEMPGQIDPLSWLETLASGGGGSSESFVGTADVPDLAQFDAGNFAPPESQFAPYSTPPGGDYQGFAEPAPSPSTAEEESPLGWLEALAKDQGSDVTEFLTDLSGSALPDFDFEVAPVEAETQPLELPPIQLQQLDVQTMSDEQIAHMQARGLLTPEQELEWLKRKVASYPKEEDFADQPMEDMAAIQGEVPDWIKQQIDVGAIAESSPFVDSLVPPEIPAAPAGWLDEGEGMPAELILEETQPISVTQEARALVNDYDPSADHWAEALDLEYTMRKQGIELTEQEPEWYTQAVSRIDEMEAFAEELAAPLTVAEEIEIEAAEPAEVPSWMQQAMVTDEEPAAAVAEPAGGLPDWLQGVEPTQEIVAADTDLPEWLRTPVDSPVADISDWLREEISTPSLDWMPPAAEAPATPPPSTPAKPAPPPAAQPASVKPAATLPAETLPAGVEGELPSWYRGAAPAKPAPAPAPAAARPQPPQPATPVYAPPVYAPPVYAQPVPSPLTPAVVPDAPEFTEYRTKLSQNPNDHSTRLQLARALNQRGNINASVEQYETLVQNSTHLEAVTTDLQLSIHPRARRLLGDIYMRQGRLQEALDTYRNALNQL